MGDFPNQFSIEHPESLRREALIALGNAWVEIVGGENPDLQITDSNQEIVDKLYKALIPTVDQTLKQFGVEEGLTSAPIKTEADEISICQQILPIIKEIPPMMCGSFPKYMQITGKCNCAGGILLAERVFQKHGIRYFHANPAKHVASVIKTRNNNFYYIDTGTVTSDPNDTEFNIVPLTDFDQTEIAGQTVLKISSPKIDYQLIPIMRPEASVQSILANIESLHPEDGLTLEKESQAIYRAHAPLINKLREFNINGILFPHIFKYYESPEYQAECAKFDQRHSK